MKAHTADLPDETYFMNCMEQGLRPLVPGDITNTEMSDALVRVRAEYRKSNQPQPSRSDINIINNQRIDNNGNTALHYAAVLRDLELIRILTSLGVNRTVKNYSGQRPIDVTTSYAVRALLNKEINILKTPNSVVNRNSPGNMSHLSHFFSTYPAHRAAQDNRCTPM